MKVFLDIEENLAHGGNQGADDGRKRSEAVTKQLFWLYDEKRRERKKGIQQSRTLPGEPSQAEKLVIYERGETRRGRESVCVCARVSQRECMCVRA